MYGVDGDVHHDDTKEPREPGSCYYNWVRAELKQTDWNAGANEASETIEKPEALTAKD